MSLDDSAKPVGTDAGRVETRPAGMDAGGVETRPAGTDAGAGDPKPVGPDAGSKRLRNAALIVYVLQALSLMLGFTLIIGAIISHWHLRAAGNTWLASHFRWQILTFWLFFMWFMFAALTLRMGFVGYLVGAAAGAWLIYRFVKGWSRLNADAPVGVR